MCNIHYYTILWGFMIYKKKKIILRKYELFSVYQKTDGSFGPPFPDFYMKIFI